MTMIKLMLVEKDTENDANAAYINPHAITSILPFEGGSIVSVNEGNNDTYRVYETPDQILRLRIIALYHIKSSLFVGVANLGVSLSVLRTQESDLRDTL